MYTVTSTYMKYFMESKNNLKFYFNYKKKQFKFYSIKNL